MRRFWSSIAVGVSLIIVTAPAPHAAEASRLPTAVGLKGEVIRVPADIWWTDTYGTPADAHWSSRGELAFNVGRNVALWRPGQASVTTVAGASDPAWFPDGVRLLVADAVEPVEYSILNTQTGERRPLCGSTAGDTCMPEYVGSAPFPLDNSHIVVSGRSYPPGAGSVDLAAVITQHPDGTTSRQDVGGTSAEDNTRWLRWSADGRVLPLEQSHPVQNFGTPYRLLVMDVPSGAVRIVPTPFGSGYLNFYGASPDGRWIAGAHQPRGAGGYPRDKPQTIVAVNAANGESTCLTCRLPVGQGTYSLDHAWSPDSRYFAFQHETGKASSSGIYVRDMTSGRTRHVPLPNGHGFFSAHVTDSASPYPGAWSPDSRFLLFSCSRRIPNSYLVDACVFDTRTSKVTIVGTTANGDLANGDITNPVFSPDGRYILFASDAKNLPGGVGHNPSGYSRMYVKRFTLP